MKTIRKILLSLFILGAGTAGFVYLQGPGKEYLDDILYYKPCGIVKTYKLGQLDPRFNLSKSDALKYTDDSAGIWNNAYGKTLFKDDVQGLITVDFVYDERQKLKEQIDTTQGNVDDSRQNLEQRIADFKSTP